MKKITASIANGAPAGFALLLAVISALALRPSIRGYDGHGNYSYVMSIVNDGDLDLNNDYAAIDSMNAGQVRLSDEGRHPTSGLAGNRYGIGAAIFWAPFVFGVHELLQFTAPESSMGGLGRPYEWAVGIASAWWAGLGLWLIFVFGTRRFSIFTASIGCLGFLLATPLCFYAWMHGSMSHAVSFFVASLALLGFEAALRKRSRASFVVLGLWGGLMATTRFQDLTWTVALGVGLFCFLNGALPRRFIAIGLYALGALIGLLPQMAVWKILYGSWLSGPTPYFDAGGGRFEWVPSHLLSVLFSQRAGFIAWHPILLIAIVGLIWIGIRSIRTFDRSAVLEFLKRGQGDGGDGQIDSAIAWTGFGGLLLQLYVVSSWSMWYAGASFGNRFFISSYPFLAFGLMFIMSRLGQRLRGRLVMVLLIASLTLWNAGLLVQYGVPMISREKEEGWGQVLSNQFSEVPEWVLNELGI